MNVNWKALWLHLFGTTQWCGVDLGFWVAMAAVVLIVVGMNLIFWSMKPAPKEEEQNPSAK